MSLMPVAEAQARLLALAPPIGTVDAPLDACIGLHLTANIKARRTQPWADLSAMDGYAICFADLPGPWRITGESAAGGPPPPAISKGEAVRIFTGAPLPQGADTIVVQEDTAHDGELLRLSGDGPARSGAHVRRRGADFATGDFLLPAGTWLGSTQLGLAALAGYGTLPVRRRLRVATFSTGNELVRPGVPVQPGQLPNSNGIMLRAMLTTLPCDVEDLGIIGDDLQALTAAFARASSADIVVTTGGASVGEHDLVRPAFEGAGGNVDFWKIRMRPGKPLMAGRIGEALFLGLPGNPVSAFVTATLFLLPLARHLSGDPAPLPVEVQARLGADLPATHVRAEYLRARLQDGVATPLGDQDSAGTRALAAANALILRMGDAPPLPAGSLVTAIPLPGGR